MKRSTIPAILILPAAIAATAAACVQISDPASSGDSTSSHSTNFSTSAADAITGTVTLTVTTKTFGGSHAPKNIVALWVEDSTGAFVRTLGVRANTRKKYLDLWIDSQGSSTVPSDVDAVSGATRPDHSTPSPLVVTWDGKNPDGTTMARGTYRMRGQMTEQNSSGENFSVDLVVDGADANPADAGPVPGFQSILASYAFSAP